MEEHWGVNCVTIDLLAVGIRRVAVDEKGVRDLSIGRKSGAKTCEREKLGSCSFFWTNDQEFGLLLS